MNKVVEKELRSDIDALDPKEYIIIKGARVNNLKNLSVAVPRYKLVVITGPSGSGKSSLAFDTLFAEGQRMYVESLSSYARQFLGRMEKPEVEYIKGVSPAIAIEQKVSTRNPRSTVGTSTEIYDYLKLLFARIGTTYSPVSNKKVTRDTVTSVVDFLLKQEDGKKLLILSPFLVHKNRTLEQELNILLSKGFTRLLVDGDVYFIEEILEDPDLVKKKDNLYVVIDRAVVKKDDEETQFRLSDSVQTAFFEGDGVCVIDLVEKGKKEFSDKFELDGIKFESPTVNLFSFNNPYGACKTCEGFGKVLGIDPDRVIPDKGLSVFDGAIVPWRSESMKQWLDDLVKNAIQFDFPIHRPYHELDEKEKELLWTGNKYFKGLNAFFKHLETKTHKIQYRVLLSRYRGRTVCPDCKGSRLRKDASYVKINDHSIIDLVLMPVEKVKGFFDGIKLNEYETKVAQRILKELKNRLDYLCRVGLGYLTLNRLTSTLSGGEFQRIKLATSLGSALVGSMYVLDEPSIGLHPRDTERLISVLKTLRDLGNTVIVVEHEEEVMRSADQIIDIGPDAGSNGGELVFQGSIDELNGYDTHTARYLMEKDVIEVPKIRRKWKDSVEIVGARENNLKNISVKIPLDVLTVITGVSGSGKSTLVKKILHPAIGKILGTVGESTGKFDRLEGDYKKIGRIEFVDQNPIGKSSRSNPVTYVKAYDPIRQLFADQPLSKQRGYKPAFFSFNVDGGRCETCQGEGIVKIEMQFMADINLTCESCKGKRFKQEILEVKYKEKDISDILALTIDESIEFFHDKTAILNKLLPLQEVGMGYVRLGQSSSSLSGGEAQRVKLASYLGKGSNASKEHTLFIFDEPTTGLHFHDIRKLLGAINALVDGGNSAVIIEHNMEVIKSADWIIDLGPEGGENGGNINFCGIPEKMIEEKKNHTARFLREKL
ncbi:excinuclease ABC subunit UvrA [Fulvivirgaceae bacterium BMA10]|uniref:UvrABC system protein A n=1 Tax=Splendidivirga corallicola TaxID=3051826 RepID=A0ABT8KUE0_9BACT|nr:excinuclease ABC subunit UvrA [Fulvivirgaceae bacterium BMA10]